MHARQSLVGARAAIYARYSSERQRETSIDDQVRRCRDYIAQAGGDPDTAIVFSDFAISGASLDRPGFESLMAAVDERRIDVIVTEDISRISRDFADSATVFKRLQFAQIPLIGIADGIDTSSRDAKLSYTLKSLVADLYLDDLRDKTLRGLEGRARAGYATGNTPYGFRTRPEHRAGGIVGHRISIHHEQAEIVRRIFAMYRDGQSMAGIARTLNAEGILSPRAGTRHKRCGWGASTIRAMLRNERYAGVWKFKETQWVKVPGSNKRRPRKRADSEVIRQERPELRIVDAESWDEVQGRLGVTHRKYTRNQDGSPKGRARRPKSSPYLLSGLLYCAECKAPMTITAGSSAAYYRCSTYRKKGRCGNKRSIREDVIRRRFLARLREAIMTPEAVAYVREQAARRLAEFVPWHHAEIERRRELLDQIESRIQGLLVFIADGERSAYTRLALRELAAQAKAEKAEIRHLVATASRARGQPRIDEVTKIAFELSELMTGQVDTSRERLCHLLGAAPIELNHPVASQRSI